MVTYPDQVLQERRTDQASMSSIQVSTPSRLMIYHYLWQIRPQPRPLFNFQWLLQLGIRPEHLCYLLYGATDCRRCGQHITPLLDG